MQQGHDLPEGLTHSWNDVNGRTFDFSGRTSDQILQDGRVARAAVHAQCSWDPNVGGTGTEDQQQGDRPKIHTAPQWERPLKSTRRMSLLEANVLDERMRQFLHAGFFSFTGKEQQQLHRATNYCFLSSIACGVVTAVASRRITPLAVSVHHLYRKCPRCFLSTTLPSVWDVTDGIVVESILCFRMLRVRGLCRFWLVRLEGCVFYGHCSAETNGNA